MPFSNLFSRPCLHPAESFIQSSLPPRSSSTIRNLLRRLFLKKRSVVIQHRSQSSSTRKFYRLKGSNIVREINPTNNYDMTILHDDELDNTKLATLRRPKKQIPSWANKDQLELAIINQVYFQDKNPENIFGSVCIDHAFDMINSIHVQNKKLTSKIVSRRYV